MEASADTLWRLNRLLLLLLLNGPSSWLALRPELLQLYRLASRPQVDHALVHQLVGQLERRLERERRAFEAALQQSWPS